ncbi:MAG: DUF2283 domain-containing protein [Methanobrevibacter sp.]|jgi:uncharacterized protein YuzE|nr:DUF2283 domain-containing protein [Candidatus Methanoflexus mossambicus]
MFNEIKPITYTYDPLADALFIQVENYEHENTIELNNDVMMDFNKNDEFIALEILSASKVLDTTKFSLKNIISIDLHLKITNDQIFINSIFTYAFS